MCRGARLHPNGGKGTENLRDYTSIYALNFVKRYKIGVNNMKYAQILH